MPCWEFAACQLPLLVMMVSRHCLQHSCRKPKRTSTHVCVGAMMNALQINPNWKSYYHHPEKATLGAINAMLPAGKIIGFLFVAPFSNRFGRKTALMLSFAITVVGAAIQTASNNLGVLIFSRFFLGFGCGVMSQPSPILLAEMAYPPHRGKLTALYHCFYVRTETTLDLQST